MRRATLSDGLVALGTALVTAAVGLLAGWAWALLVLGLLALAAGLAAAWGEAR